MTAQQHAALLAQQGKFLTAIRQLPENEAEWYRGALADLSRIIPEDPQRVMEAVTKLAAHQAYNHRKKASDARTQHDRRVLVGANVPWSLADRCRRAAARRGVSLTQWATDAFRARLGVSE